MSDPRLNSIHLEFPRREQYQDARDRLLSARGPATQAEEKLASPRPNYFGWDALPFPDSWPAGAKALLLDPVTTTCYPLHVGFNSIGRFRDNDIVLDDWDGRRLPAISRRHCVILIHATGGYEIHDTTSLNGTFRNGIRVNQVGPLFSGDVIQIAKQPLVFLSEDDCHYLSENIGPGRPFTIWQRPPYDARHDGKDTLVDGGPLPTPDGHA